MSQEVVTLNREELRPLEPFETDSTSSAWLTPWAFPNRFAIVTNSNNMVSRIEFHYSSKTFRAEPRPIDEAVDPIIVVAFSEGISRVLSVDFIPPVEFKQVRLLAPRIRKAAESDPTIGKRLSLRLIASILEMPSFESKPNPGEIAG